MNLKKSFITVVVSGAVVINLTGCDGAKNGLYQANEMGMGYTVRVNGNTLTMNFIGQKKIEECDEITYKDSYLRCKKGDKTISHSITRAPQ